MTDIQVINTEDQEDGSLIVQFAIDSKTEEYLLSTGLELVIYSALLNMSTKEVFKLLENMIREEEKND